MKQRIAAIFPGVGSQYVGMGKAFYGRYPIYRETIDEASELLGRDISKSCFSPDEKTVLNQQETAQICVFVTSVAMYRVFAALGLPVSYYAGHSLGEYSALCCSGALDFRAALELVRRRGELIRETARSLGGTMVWVIGLEVETVEAVCRRRADAGLEVFLSACDAPRQAAISGRKKDVGEVAAELESRGAVVYPLRFEGPYHSPLMLPAARGLEAVLESVSITQPTAPVLSNVDAEPHEGGRQSARRLVDQITSPVRWLAQQRRLVAEGVDLAVEIGPGHVLGFLMQKTTELVRPWKLDGHQSIEEFHDALRVGEPDYLGIIEGCLRLAVSTPNRGQDPEAHRTRVVPPYRRLEELWQSARDRTPLRRDDVAQALADVAGILHAKGLSGAELRRRVNLPLGGKLWTA